MRRGPLVSALGLAAVGAVGLAGPGHAADGSPAPPRAGGYLGAAACGACHAEALAVWRRSGHPRAMAGLDAGEQARRACQACNATGDAPAAPAAVEFEACHGAGAEHAAVDVMRDPSLAGALGLRGLADPRARAALCLGCHDGAASAAPFDGEAAWRAIAH